MFYNIIKSLHIISIVAWMAGMLYLPRLFVYHSMEMSGSPTAGVFMVMERRLLKAIMLPAMVASWGFGIWLAVLSGAFGQGWLHLKLLLVVGMTAMHGLFAREARRLASGGALRPTRLYRILNEVPTLLLVAIVVLAVLKPF